MTAGRGADVSFSGATAAGGGLVCLVLAAGCAASSPGMSPQNQRRAERVPVLPAPVTETEASDGVSVLRAPPARQLARRAVQAFFDAVQHESVGELSAWLAEEATISSGPGTTPESIAKVWAARFKQLDYGFSGATDPYRPDDVGLFTADELLGLAPARRFELVPDADELLAVVTTRDRRRAAGPRHFGKRLEFVLSPTTDGYRIRRMFEDFRLP